MISKTYFELVKPTYLENWPQELCQRSLAQVCLKLSREEINDILQLAWEGKVGEHLTYLHQRLNQELIKFPKGAFVRLGSRSPKDMGIKPVSNGADVINLFIGSMRIFDDLSLAYGENYDPYIFLREWVSIDRAFEFRCFMKDRKLVGISQYNYREVFPEIKENELIIQQLIHEFFKDFKEISHLDTVIFDVFITRIKTGNVNSWEIKLLEINPSFELTDPCLFDWRKPENFQGQFLFKE